MYVTTLTPTKESHTFDLPEEFYGKEIIVTAEPISSNITENKNHKISDIEAIFSKYKQIDMSNFKFDREDANDFS